MNKYILWFRWAMLLGFVVTNFFALPGIFQPGAVADLIGATPPKEPVWAAFGFLLSFLVSWFYIPAALNPLGNLPTAWLSVVAQFGSALFWFWLYGYFEPGPVPLIGKIDLALGLAQFVLLVLAVRTPSVSTS